MMNSKFNYYDITIIKTTDPKIKKFNGLEATIQGKSQSEEDPAIWAYSVSIDGLDECYFVFEKDLYPTGRIAKEEHYMSQDTIRVRVDPETGEGNIVEEE